VRFGHIAVDESPRAIVLKDYQARIWEGPRPYSDTGISRHVGLRRARTVVMGKDAVERARFPIRNLEEAD
jgi:hypothetical protein